MTINIADNSPRVSYSVAEGVTQTSFTVSFEFFDNDDLNVYVDGTLKTLTTDYTVSGGDGSTGTVTISVTGATGGSTVVITRDIELERTTDFPASGAFNIATLNTELDRIIAITADLDDRASRALQLTDYDAAANLTLPDLDTRKGKTLAFNLTTGAVEAGPSTSDVQSVSDTAADIALLADIQDGTLATNAITNVNTIRTDVTTVAGISGNVTTVAGNNANVTTVATDLSGSDTIGTVAGSISNVNTVATDITNVNTTATNISNVNTVAGEIGVSGVVTIVANAITDVSTVSGDIAAVITAANDLNEAVSEIDTVANAITNVDTVGTNIANVNTVAGISSDVTAVAADGTDIGTVATNISNVNTVAGISGNVTTVAGVSANVTTVAGISADVTAVAGDATDIGTVATDLAGSNTIGTVAGSISNVNSVAGNSTNINAVAGNATNINAVAADATDIGTVAADLAGSDNIGTVAGSIANVNTVATNITGVNSFAERYRVEATNPTTSLDAGDLAYVTGDTVLKYYNGTSWQSISPGLGAVSDDSNPSLGGVLSTSGNNIEFGDSTGAEVNRLKLGAGDDLQIYHDGTYNYIEAGSTTSTDLRIISTDDIIIGHGTPTSYETMAAFLSDGSVNLYYDNYQKLNTNSTGVNVNGTLFADYVDASPTVRTSSSDSGTQGTKYLKLATLNAFSPSTSNSLFIIDVILEGRSDPQGCQAFRLYLRAADTASDSRFEVEDLRVQDYSNVSSLYSESNFHWYWNSQSNQELWIQIPNSSDTSYLEAFTRLVSAASQDTSYISGYEDLTLQTGQSWTTSNPSGSNRITAEFVTKRFKDLHLDNGIKYAADLSKRIEFTTSGSDIVADVTAELRADSYNETYAAVTSSSNSTTVNCHNGNAFSHTLTENTTFTFSNPPPSGNAYSFSIEIIQDSSASGYTVTWPSSVDWPSATAPTLTATASAKDVFVFYTRDGGTNWYGFTAGQALG